jgi:hypothetical protein
MAKIPLVARHRIEPAVPRISVHHRAVEVVAPVIGAEIAGREDHLAVREPITSARATIELKIKMAIETIKYTTLNQR